MDNDNKPNTTNFKFICKIKITVKEVKPKSMGMMSRSRTTVQEMSDTEKQPAIIAKEMQMYIRNARNTQKNGDKDDGTIV